MIARLQFCVGFVCLSWLVGGVQADEPASAPVNSLRLQLPSQASPVVSQLARVFARQLADRCDAKVVGDDDRGLVYGVGKVLQTSRSDCGGFTPGTWRGTSVPTKPIRGIYSATHFHNFYHDAPVEKVVAYVEDLALWGFNEVAVWYDMHHFDGFEDPDAVAFRARLRAILLAAKRIGMDVSLLVIANCQPWGVTAS